MSDIPFIKNLMKKTSVEQRNAASMNRRPGKPRNFKIYIDSNSPHKQIVSIHAANVLVACAWVINRIRTHIGPVRAVYSSKGNKKEHPSAYTLGIYCRGMDTYVVVTIVPLSNTNKKCAKKRV